MKNFLLGVLTVALFISGCVGCDKGCQLKANPADVTPKLYTGKIILGAVVWPGYLPLYVARDKGYFKQSGLDVEIKTYVSQGECSRDYVGGKLQGRANLTSEMINEVLLGLDQKIVLVIDYSNGSDGIAATSAINGLLQAKGKKVAYEHGTLEEYFLAYALERNGMTLQDIVPVNLDPEASAKALSEGTVDVAVTYEPYLSATIDKIKGNTIYSSADAPGLITDILTLRTDFITAYPETVAVLVRDYFRALELWKQNPDEAQAIVAKQFGGTKEEIGQQLKGIAMLDQRDNTTALTNAAGAQSLYGNLRNVGDFLLRKKPGKAQLDTDQLIDPQFTRRR